ncbi:MAG: hypothetical protein PHE86_04665 [Candidatus Marinimicrobia bacterium]|nr:hypothetical protein [Candidatus Neomarinimicrobiota bacterium]MDD5489398.1 hypothetical protein [Candidatus Moranbacteria bacterium]
MKNIFILYIPTGNYEALVHYEDTIKNRVSQQKIVKYVDENLKNKLRNIFGSKPIATWGSRNSDANRSKFERMQPGDDILIVEGDTVRLLGKIAEKTINQNLSRELWKNLRGTSSDGWDLIYFIANPLEIELPFNEFKKIFNYAHNWSLRGFTSIADEKLKEFYSKYDDLYSVLQKIKSGDNIEEKEDVPIENEKIELQQEDIEEVLGNKELSDHIIMQWKLIGLGMKAGSKVWIPKNDQSRINKEYRFSNFEKEFTAGLDTPAKYVENIDVVWKEEYRIDAAFEIENSTSIYSGLLRFADLKIVAPNSPYPLYIVAPISKKKRLIDQIKRPTFKRLEFGKKVRYLSYESINEIDKFFTSTASGFNADVLRGKSELIN